MKKFMSVLAMLMAFMFGSISSVKAGEATITPIFTGGGESTEGWREAIWYDQWITGQVGMRMVNMVDQSSVHTEDTYTVPKGDLWRLEYSLNTSFLRVADYQFKLLVDQDLSQGERFVVVDPLSAWSNFYGNYNTLAGEGVLGEKFPYAYQNTIAQQSLGMGVDTSFDATLTYRILVYDSEGTTLLCSHTIKVVVGIGGLPPDVVLYPLVDVNGAKAGTTSITNYVIPGGTLTLQDKVDALRVQYAKDNKKYRAAIAALADAEYKAKRITRAQRDQMKQMASVLP